MACDRLHPTCTSCVEYEVQCVYSTPTRKRGRPRTSVYGQKPAVGDGDAVEGSDDAASSPRDKDQRSSHAGPSTSASAQSLAHGLDNLTGTAAAAVPAPDPAVQPRNNDEVVPSNAIPEGPTRPSSPTPLRAGPPEGLDAIMPIQAVLDIVDLYFTTLWTHLPIVHRPTLLAGLRERADRHQPALYILLLNICAATCAANRSRAPFPSLVACQMPSWEDAGRFFNRATIATGHRIQHLAKAGSTVCAQNVLLVAAYESSMGSRVAERLYGEAERIAMASHYDTDKIPRDAVTREMRRRIYWVLCAYGSLHFRPSPNPLADLPRFVVLPDINDKIRALMNCQPMVLRSDEGTPDTPRILHNEHDEAPPSPLPIETVHALQSLRIFNAVVSLCRGAEHAILQWRRLAAMSSASQTVTNLTSSLNDSISHIFSLTVSFGELASAPAISILKHAIRIERECHSGHLRI